MKYIRGLAAGGVVVTKGVDSARYVSVTCCDG
jgi:hypothetical protein